MRYVEPQNTPGRPEIGPVIGCYGGRDRDFSKTPGTLTRRLGEVGVTPEVHVWEDAGHSFLTDGDHPVARVLYPPLALGDYPEAREEGWARIFAFLDRHLS